MFGGGAICGGGPESDGGNDCQHAPGELWEVRGGE